MQLKKAISLLLVMHAYMPAITQNTCHSMITGQVLDESSLPVVGATLVLVPGKGGQVSDSNGNFRFENLCAGSYTIQVQYVGYQTEEIQIQLLNSSNRVIKLAEAASELREVVVVGHHDAEQIEHASNFVQLTDKQLAESAGKSLGEVLKEVSGVNSIQSGPGIFKPVIHGLHSQRVLILNYGIRQEGQQWGAEHAPEIDPFMASNIIVIKDASAIKYGTDALGGVIVVNPPELPVEAALGGTVQTVVQSNGRSGTISGMVEGGIRKHDGWGWRLQGTAKRTGDFNTPRYSLTNSGIREHNFSASTGYHQKNAGLELYFSHFQTEIGILKGTAIGSLDDLLTAMERDVPQYTSGFSYDIGEPRQHVSHNLLKLNGHLLAGRGEWRVQYGFQNNVRKEFDIRIGDLSKIPAIDLQLNTHTLETVWETHHTEKGTASFGVNGMYQQNKNIPGTQRIPFIPDFKSVSAGAFAITKLYRKTWTIDLGARYDFRYYDVKGYDFKNTLYTSSFSFNNISATAGARVKLSKEQELTLNLSSAWRPPHVAELFSIGTHQSAAAIEYGLLLNDKTNEVMDLDHADFKTEQALKFVTTYRGVWKDHTIEVTPYVNYVFNYIYLRPTGVTRNVRGVYPYFRYAQTDAMFVGADISGTWRVCSHLKVIPRVSLLRASDKRNHDYLVYIPSNTYDVTFRYERAILAGFRNFYVASGVKYVARQNRAPRVVTVREIIAAQEQQTDPFENDKSNFDFMAAPNGYALWNLAAGISRKAGKVQYDFSIASNNTLNRQYREYTNRFRYYADDMGQNIIFSLKCIF